LYPENAMALAVLNVPAYPSLSGDQIDEFQTINQNAVNLIRDTSTTITSSLVTNRRYTMKDIGTLDNRITNLEYYAQLSLLEKKAKDLTVTDSYGLDRFKNGIFVDPFTDFGLSDVSNPEFAIAIDSDIGVARPRITREIVNIRFNSAASSNVVQTGRLITLQYDSVSFISQRFATKYRSSALVAYAWNGQAQLIPSYDNNIDINQTASVNMTVDMTAPWKEFAASPFGTQWGAWRTRTDVSRTTVITGTASSLVYDAWGRLVSSTPIIGPSTTTTSWSTGDTQTVQSSVAATAQQSLTEAQRVSGTIGLTAASNTTTVTTTVDATRNRLLQFIAGGVSLSNLLSLL
jgi:YD repeat-containing protein